MKNLQVKLMMASMMVVGLVVMGCPPSGGSGALSTKPADGAVKMEMYVMSQCPYGLQVENSITPVLNKLGNMVDFNLEFIGSIIGDGQFKCLHGEPECNGNKVQLCAKKYEPAKYMDMVLCMNKNARQIPNNWESCASSAGIDVSKVKSCYEGSEGNELAKTSYETAQRAGARGSPTIMVNGKRYSGGRTEKAFMRALCNEMDPATRPESCSTLPPPVDVNLTVIGDKRCKDCGFRSNRFVSRLKMDMPGLKVKMVDYSEEEGKKLFKEYKLSRLPAFVFDKNVEKVEEARRYIMRSVKVGDNRILPIGNFDPTAEICDNKIDDTANGKVDCADDTCKDTLMCRKEAKGKLEVFVMSQCPYGVRALNSMKEVLDAFPQMDFKVNFIADEIGPGKFKALHGQPEVDENIRELCAIKHYGKNHKYMNYVLCRNKNIRSSSWEECATKETGVDAKVIKKCVDSGEGAKMHSDNIKIAKRLEIGASPTWVANNKFKFSGIAANDIKNNFCKYNPGTKGCDKELSKDAQVKGSCN